MNLISRFVGYNIRIQVETERLFQFELLYS